MERKPSRALLPLALALSLTALTALAAWLTLENLGPLIRRFGDGLGEETKLLLADVFGQLSHAVLRPHFLVPLLLWLALAFLFQHTRCRGKLLSLCLTPLALLLGYAAALLLAQVNGIRLWDVLSSLAGIIANGGLDSL